MKIAMVDYLRLAYNVIHKTQHNGYKMRDLHIIKFNIQSGLEMNQANRAEGLLRLGSGARTELSTEQLEMQLTNA